LVSFFYEEIEVLDEEYTAFAYMDSYTAFRNDDEKICWIDYDTFGYMSGVAKTPSAFLDCVYEFIKYRIYRDQTELDIFHKLVDISQCDDSEVFYKYLIGLD